MNTFTAPVTDTYAHEIAQAIETNGWVALVAEVGAGKTHLMNQVKRRLADQNIVFVDSDDLTDRSLTIASILRDVIMKLGEEPKRSSSALSHQAIRLLGHAVKSKRQKVCLVIDDAQRAHGETLAALKRLREKDFAGIAPLLSIVLIGHPALAQTLERREEIGWRCDAYHLDEDAGWMTPPERVRFLEVVFEDLITPSARERIAALCRLPAQMNQFVHRRLREARRLGLGVLDDQIVRPTLREMKDALGEEVASVRKIARAAGLSPTSVQQALTDGETSPHSEAVRQAMERIAGRQAQPKKAA